MVFSPYRSIPVKRARCCSRTSVSKNSTSSHRLTCSMHLSWEYTLPAFQGDGRSVLHSEENVVPSIETACSFDKVRLGEGLAMHQQDGIDVLASNILISHMPFPISIQVFESFGMAKSRGNFLLRLWRFGNRQSRGTDTTGM